VRAKGAASDLATAQVALSGGSVVIGRMVAGSMLDRYRPRIVSPGMMTAIDVDVLILYATPPGPATMTVAVIQVGIWQGADVNLIACFSALYPGICDCSNVPGVLLLGAAVSSAFGAIAFGEVYDRLGSVSLELVASAVFNSAAAVLCAWLDRYSMLPGQSRLH
jgi:MFS transporter, OFA family, oxalate/formate antiporter